MEIKAQIRLITPILEAAFLYELLPGWVFISVQSESFAMICLVYFAAVYITVTIVL